MADFNQAFDAMIANEGGYTLHKVQGDRGGQTYAGIARQFHPAWPGWRFIDAGDLQALQLSRLVRDFYFAQFWQPVRGDEITEQEIAQSLFDFAVNAGVPVAVKLAQITVGAVPDGRLGPVTLAALNSIAPPVFALKYALAKIARYAEICNRDKSQSKFLLGWTNRTLKGLQP